MIEAAYELRDELEIFKGLGNFFFLKFVYPLRILN